MNKKQEKKDILLNFHVDKKLLKELKDFCYKSNGNLNIGWTMSFVIREAIKRFINREQVNNPKGNSLFTCSCCAILEEKFNE